MRSMIHLAYYHHGYGYHGHAMTGWIGHMVVSSVVHAVIYGLVFKLMRNMTLPEAALLVCAVLAGLFLWARSRERRGF